MRNTAALKMLFHDRASALGSIAGVVAIVFLVGQQLAIFFGLLSFTSSLADNSAADIWILSKKSDNLNSSGTLPMAYRDRAAGLRGIQWVEPLVLSGALYKRRDGNTQAVQVVGVRYPRLAGGPNRFFLAGPEALGDGEGITVDRLDLPALGRPSIGDVVELNGRRVRIKAVTDGLQGFAGSQVFTGLENARAVTGMPVDRCTDLLVKAVPGVPIEGLIDLLKRVLPRTEVFSTQNLSRSTRLYILRNTGIGVSFGFTTLIGAAVGFIIIALTMYTNVLNKSRDYAMLRALGARKRDVFVIVFLQSLYVAAIGILSGFFLLAAFLSGTRGSSLPTGMPVGAAATIAAGTLLLCLAGSVLAMRRAAKAEPAGAFR